VGDAQQSVIGALDRAGGDLREGSGDVGFGWSAVDGESCMVPVRPALWQAVSQGPSPLLGGVAMLRSM
jgi:hypothetical protein